MKLRTKKMSLNKTTVSNLESIEMNEVKGGTHTGITCVFCDSHVSCYNGPCLWQVTCMPGCY